MSNKPIGDGVTDDTKAIQAIHDKYALKISDNLIRKLRQTVKDYGYEIYDLMIKAAYHIEYQDKLILKQAKKVDRLESELELFK